MRETKNSTTKKFVQIRTIPYKTQNKNSKQTVQTQNKSNTNSLQPKQGTKRTTTFIHQPNSPQKPTTIEIEIPITLNWVMPIKSILNTIKEQDTSQKMRSKQKVF